jgi:hypothetical protein
MGTGILRFFFWPFKAADAAGGKLFSGADASIARGDAIR